MAGGPGGIGRAMAILAHRAAIEEIAEIQQREVLRGAAKGAFGSRTLPLREFTRRMLANRGQMLSVAAERFADEAAGDTKRLNELYPIVELLEAAFAEYHQAGDAAFARWMADHMAEARRD